MFWRDNSDTLEEESISTRLQVSSGLCSQLFLLTSTQPTTQLMHPKVRADTSKPQPWISPHRGDQQPPQGSPSSSSALPVWYLKAPWSLPLWFVCRCFYQWFVLSCQGKTRSKGKKKSVLEKRLLQANWFISLFLLLSGTISSHHSKNISIFFKKQIPNLCSEPPEQQQRKFVPKFPIYMKAQKMTLRLTF